MILVDTSIWIDHLRSGSDELIGLLDRNNVVGHPWVTGELALGNLGRRDDILKLLHSLPQAVVAGDDEILRLIDQEQLSGSGIGYIDAQLLAAARLTADTLVWTRDKRLAAVASRMGQGFASTGS